MKPETLKRLQSGGTTPVEILREIKSRHPDAHNAVLALLFDEECGPISDKGHRRIWRWKADRAHGLFNDEQLNAELTKILQDAGHDIPGEGPKEPEYKMTREQARTLAEAALDKLGIRREVEPDSVHLFPAQAGPPGREWCLTFKRTEPDKQGKVANVFVHDETGEARVGAFREDAK